MSDGKAIFVDMQSQIEYINFSSADFDLSRSSHYHVVIDSNMASEAMLAFFENKTLKYLSSIRDFLKQNPDKKLSATDFAKVSLLIPTLDVSFVPTAVFESTALAVYEQSLLDDGISDTKSVALKKLGITAVYREDLLGLNTFIRDFPTANRVIVPQAILEALQPYLNNKSATILGLHNMSSETAFYVFDQGQFKYFDVCSITNEKDLSLHVAKILNLIGCKSDQMSVLLSGEIQTDDFIFTTLSRYFSTISFADIQQMTALDLPDSLASNQHRLLGVFSLLSIS